MAANGVSSFFFYGWVIVHCEEGMATHSSILAWRIAWTGELGGLQSMGSHRVRHGWSDLARTHTKSPQRKPELWVLGLLRLTPRLRIFRSFSRGTAMDYSLCAWVDKIRKMLAMMSTNQIAADACLFQPVSTSDTIQSRLWVKLTDWNFKTRWKGHDFRPWEVQKAHKASAYQPCSNITEK